jgi:hypothetical protein
VTQLRLNLLRHVSLDVHGLAIDVVIANTTLVVIGCS